MAVQRAPRRSWLTGRLVAAEAANRPLFWAKVDMLGTCWTWNGARTEWGYGKLRYAGMDFAAHRCVYELQYGRLPDDMFVCHKCDNPPCVKPSHLFLGTAQDNTLDMHRKGRAARLGPRGEANSSARLTNEMVIQIREDFRGGALVADLAEQFGFTREYIRLLVKGKAWAHIGGPICDTDLRAGNGRKKAS